VVRVTRAACNARRRKTTAKFPNDVPEQIIDELIAWVRSVLASAVVYDSFYKTIHGSTDPCGFDLPRPSFGSGHSVMRKTFLCMGEYLGDEEGTCETHRLCPGRNGT
jgi:hypothetical protein